MTVILCAELTAVAWLLFALADLPVRRADVGRFILIFAVAVAYVELGSRIERIRKFLGYVENSTFADAAGLWCFGAALVLPVGLTGVFVVLIHLHTALRSRHEQPFAPFRFVYSATAVLIAAMVACDVVSRFGVDALRPHDVHSGLLALVAVIAAMFGYAVVNRALIYVVVYLVTRPSAARAVMLSGEDEMLEVATLALAVLLAVIVVHVPYLAPFTLVLIVVMRRSAMVHDLQIQATRDAKTGLLNAGAWRSEAEREISRAERVAAPISVLMIDLDHFKHLNDEFGHQAGDEALHAVGDCISDALRGHDAVGRFGGEEFVAVLSNADESVSMVVAERLRNRIRALELPHGGSVTASIGVGVGVVDRHGLDDLIGAADKALYRAKNAGRDRVRSLHASCAAVD